MMNEILYIHSSSIAIALEASYKDQAEDRDTPRSKVIPFFEGFWFSVSSHDHLIEIEGDTEGPAEVCEEEAVHSKPCDEAQSRIREEGIFEGQDE